MHTEKTRGEESVMSSRRSKEEVRSVCKYCVTRRAMVAQRYLMSFDFIYGYRNTRDPRAKIYNLVQSWRDRNVDIMVSCVYSARFCLILSALKADLSIFDIALLHVWYLNSRLVNRTASSAPTFPESV